MPLDPREQALQLLDEATPSSITSASIADTDAKTSALQLLDQYDADTKAGDSYADATIDWALTQAWKRRMGVWGRKAVQGAVTGLASAVIPGGAVFAAGKAIHDIVAPAKDEADERLYETIADKLIQERGADSQGFGRGLVAAVREKWESPKQIRKFTPTVISLLVGGLPAQAAVSAAIGGLDLTDEAQFRQAVIDAKTRQDAGQELSDLDYAVLTAASRSQMPKSENAGYMAGRIALDMLPYMASYGGLGGGAVKMFPKLGTLGTGKLGQKLVQGLVAGTAATALDLSNMGQVFERMTPVVNYARVKDADGVIDALDKAGEKPGEDFWSAMRRVYGDQLVGNIFESAGGLIPGGAFAIKAGEKGAKAAVKRILAGALLGKFNGAKSPALKFAAEHGWNGLIGEIWLEEVPTMYLGPLVSGNKMGPSPTSAEFWKQVGMMTLSFAPSMLAFGGFGMGQTSRAIFDSERYLSAVEAQSVGDIKELKSPVMITGDEALKRVASERDALILKRDGGTKPLDGGGEAVIEKIGLTPDEETRLATLDAATTPEAASEALGITLGDKNVTQTLYQVNVLGTDGKVVDHREYADRADAEDFRGWNEAVLGSKGFKQQVAVDKSLDEFLEQRKAETAKEQVAPAPKPASKPAPAPQPPAAGPQQGKTEPPPGGTAETPSPAPDAMAGQLEALQANIGRMARAEDRARATALLAEYGTDPAKLAKIAKTVQATLDKQAARPGPAGAKPRTEPETSQPPGGVSAEQAEPIAETKPEMKAELKPPVSPKPAVSADAENAGKTETEISYRGQHKAPDAESGAPLSQMDRGMYPSDLYSNDGARLYGDHVADARDRAMHNLIIKVRGNPNAEVTVYRGVPADAPATINPGDWVTPDRQYAADHAARYGKYHVAKMKVKAGELFTEGNSLYEYGYQPIPAPPAGKAEGKQEPEVRITKKSGEKRYQGWFWKQKAWPTVGDVNDAGEVYSELDLFLDGQRKMGRPAGDVATDMREGRHGLYMRVTTTDAKAEKPDAVAQALGYHDEAALMDALQKRQAKRQGKTAPTVESQLPKLEAGEGMRGPSTEAGMLKAGDLDVGDKVQIVVEQGDQLHDEVTDELTVVEKGGGKVTLKDGVEHTYDIDDKIGDWREVVEVIRGERGRAAKVAVDPAKFYAVNTTSGLVFDQPFDSPEAIAAETSTAKTPTGTPGQAAIPGAERAVRPEFLDKDGKPVVHAVSGDEVRRMLDDRATPWSLVKGAIDDIRYRPGGMGESKPGDLFHTVEGRQVTTTELSRQETLKPSIEVKPSLAASVAKLAEQGVKVKESSLKIAVARAVEGKGLDQQIERMTMDETKRGLIRAEVEKLANKEGREVFAAAWHGSGVGFDKFDMSKVGTGEGAQAFGWGMYFTDLKDIAEHYATSRLYENKQWRIVLDGKDVSGQLSTTQRQWFAWLARQFDGNAELARKEIAKRRRDQLREAKTSIQPWIPEGNAARFKEEFDLLNGVKKLEVPENRHLYRVELPDNANWLDWDRPVNERNAAKLAEWALNYAEDLNRRNPGYSMETSARIRDIWKAGEHRANGESVYHDMVWLMSRDPARNNHWLGAEGHYERAASMELRKLGIDGIRYPAGTLTPDSKPTGAKNYVVFDENAAQIVEHQRFAAFSNPHAVPSDQVQALMGEEFYRARRMVERAVRRISGGRAGVAFDHVDKPGGFTAEECQDAKVRMKLREADLPEELIEYGKQHGLLIEASGHIARGASGYQTLVITTNKHTTAWGLAHEVGELLARAGFVDAGGLNPHEYGNRIGDRAVAAGVENALAEIEGIGKQGPPGANEANVSEVMDKVRAEAVAERIRQLLSQPNLDRAAISDAIDEWRALTGSEPTPEDVFAAKPGEPADEFDKLRRELEGEKEAGARADYVVGGEWLIEQPNADGKMEWRRIRLRAIDGDKLRFETQRGGVLTLKTADAAARLKPVAAAEREVRTIEDLGLPSSKTKTLRRRSDRVQEEFMRRAEPGNLEQFDENLKAAEIAAQLAEDRFKVETAKEAGIESRAITENDYQDLLHDFELTPELRHEDGAPVTTKEVDGLIAVIKGMQGEAITRLKAAFGTAHKLRSALQDQIDSLRREVSLNYTSDKLLARFKSLGEYLKRKYDVDPEHATDKASEIGMRVPYNLLKMLERRLADQKAIPIGSLPAEMIGGIEDAVKSLVLQSETVNKLWVRKVLRESEVVAKASVAVQKQRSLWAGDKISVVSPAIGTDVVRGAGGIARTIGTDRLPFDVIAAAVWGRDSDAFQVFVKNMLDASTAAKRSRQEMEDAFEAKTAELGITAGEAWTFDGERDKRGNVTKTERFNLSDGWQYSSEKDARGSRLTAVDLTPFEALSVYLNLKDANTRAQLFDKGQRGLQLLRKADLAGSSWRASPDDYEAIGRWVEANPKLKGLADFMLSFKREKSRLMNAAYHRRYGYDLIRDFKPDHWNRRRVGELMEESVPLVKQFQWLLQDMGILQQREVSDRPFILESAVDTFSRVSDRMDDFIHKSEVIDSFLRLKNDGDVVRSVQGMRFNIGPVRFYGSDILKVMDDFVDDYQRSPGWQVDTGALGKFLRRTMTRAHGALLGFKPVTALGMSFSTASLTSILPKEIWADPKLSIVAVPITKAEIEDMKTSPIFKELLRGGIERVISPLEMHATSATERLFGPHFQGPHIQQRVNKFALDLLRWSNYPTLFQTWRWAKAMVESGRTPLHEGESKQQATARLAEELFTETQGYNSPTSMSQLQRKAQQGHVPQMIATLFQNEVTKQWGMNVEAVREYNVAQGRYRSAVKDLGKASAADKAALRETADKARKAATQAFGRVLFTGLMTFILQALLRYWLREAVNIVYSGFRPKRKTLAQHGMGMMWAVLGQDPIFGNIWQAGGRAIQGVLSGQRVDDALEVYQHPWVQALVEAPMVGYEMAKGAIDIAVGDPKAQDEVVRAIAHGLGVGAIITAMPTQSLGQALQTGYRTYRQRLTDKDKPEAMPRGLLPSKLQLYRRRATSRLAKYKELVRQSGGDESIADAWWYSDENQRFVELYRLATVSDQYPEGKMLTPNAPDLELEGGEVSPTERYIRSMPGVGE